MSQTSVYRYVLSFVYVKGVSSRAYTELPVYSKYLVIAAYIASYNPVKSDKRFFSKVGIRHSTTALAYTSSHCVVSFL